jgi:hypothetical protein
MSIGFFIAFLNSNSIIGLDTTVPRVMPRDSCIEARMEKSY